MTSSRAAVPVAPLHDRIPRAAERALRLTGDSRTAAVLILAVGAANLAAAVLPAGASVLDGWPYAALLGALALSGVASVAVRSPAVWREWRSPGPVAGSSALHATIPMRDRDELRELLGSAGYRTRIELGRGRWALHGVRRGWSRFAGVISHLGLVVIVVGAALGGAFGSETTFSLLPGEQALLDAPRPGFSSAVRLEALDAEFGDDGRPRRLDVAVALLRDGDEVRRTVLRVNEPAQFDGHLVHPWTYGPAVHLRVTTLGGSVLLDDAVPLDAERDGAPVGSIDVPTAGVTLGLALVDADENRLGLSVVGDSGLIGTARLRPGDEARVGPLMVELGGFDAWVTFHSRRDPGLLVLFAGAAMLCGALVAAFWLPRTRVTIQPMGAEVALRVRGEPLSRPTDELVRLTAVLTR